MPDGEWLRDFHRANNQSIQNCNIAPALPHE
jgi:hypothetical protein